MVHIAYRNIVFHGAVNYIFSKMVYQYPEGFYRLPRPSRILFFYDEYCPYCGVMLCQLSTVENLYVDAYNTRWDEGRKIFEKYAAKHKWAVPLTVISEDEVIVGYRDVEAVLTLLTKNINKPDRIYSPVV